MGLWKRLTRGQFFRRFLTLLCLFFAIFCILVLLCQSLPEINPSSQGRVMASESRQSENKLGELGVLMISMLPDNLAFTVFAPSDEAFEQFLDMCLQTQCQSLRSYLWILYLDSELMFGRCLMELYWLTISGRTKLTSKRQR